MPDTGVSSTNLGAPAATAAAGDCVPLEHAAPAVTSSITAAVPR
jgi:hypothetical protein